LIFVECEQGDDTWLAERIGIPTASGFDQIITPAKGELSKSCGKYLEQLLTEWIFGTAFDSGSTLFMSRGRELERRAIDWYSDFNGVEVRRIGFCKRDDWLTGCSPDFLVGDDGGGEVKCLSVARHVGALIRDVSQDADHRCQIQGCMMITGRQWWDRIYYHPELPTVVVRMKRDDTFIGRMSVAIDDFIEQLQEARQKILSMGIKPRPIPKPGDPPTDTEFFEKLRRHQQGDDLTRAAMEVQADAPLPYDLFKRQVNE